MTIAGFKQVSMIVGMAGIVTILFMKTQTQDRQAYHQTVTMLEQLKQWDATFNQELLKARMGLVSHYDPLVAVVSQLRQLERRLEPEPFAISPPGYAEVAQGIGTYRRLLSRKVEVLEEFKSQNAILQNSVRYFPRTTAALVESTALGGSSAGVKKGLENLLRHTLLYNIDRNPELRRLMRHDLDELRGAERRAPAEARAQLASVLAHAQIIYSYQMTVDELVRQFMSMPTSQAIDVLFQAYARSYEEASQRTDAYRRALYLVSVLLVAYVAFVMVRLHHTSRSLAQTNETLEWRVQERTAALATSNESLAAEITERKRAEEQLEDMAHYDPLTGLPNRRLFMDLLTQALARARRTDRLVALLFLDLNRFKLVNDSLGHAVGDMLLKAVTERLTNSLRTSDTVARLGGDEFTVILEDLSSSEDAARIAQKILEAVVPPMTLEDHEIFVSASIGIALYPADSLDGEGLIKSADTAMYAAKQQGGAFQFYSADMNTRAFERLTLETALRYALKRQEFLLHYQPLVDLHTDHPVGIEALVRWQHPVRGLLGPDKFIPLAEETGLIIPLGAWVLRTACAQTKLWQEQGFPLRRVAVNLSRRQFEQKNLVQTVWQVLKDTGLDPACLELELTESLLIQDTEGTIAMLQALNAMGIRISIDDFGSEYSSLGYLKRLPISTLKIDQSFVRDIAVNPNDASITKAIISLAHCLSLNVVAEGVETEGQATYLRSQQCNEMQGYYFSRPLTADAVTALLAGGHPVGVGAGAVEQPLVS